MIDICPRCNIKLVLGKAIEPSVEDGCIYIAPQPDINSETLNLIVVNKCPKCGMSFKINNDQ